MTSPLSKTDLAAIRWYVGECTRNVMRNKSGCATNSITVEERMAKILHKQAPLTKSMVLWRGHVGSPKVIAADTWFSSSDTRNSAKNLFTDSATGCCLFKIHVMPGIRVLNVVGTLQKSPTRKSPRKSPHKSNTVSNRKNMALKSVLEEENEWIIEGGGVFYKNKEGTQKGFQEHDGYFEAYYFPKGTFVSPKKLTVEEVVDLIDPDEYEFVDGSDYFESGVIPVGSTASPSVIEKAVKQIQALVEKA